MLFYLKAILLSAGLFTVTQAQEFANYFGSQIGVFSTLAHQVTGTVYAINSTSLWIRGFNYDGAGPDAFFWAGSTTIPSSAGEIIPDENGSVDKLGAYTNANLIINLPTGRVITDFKWISVWCRRFAANFGQVLIASDFVAPSPVSLGVLGFTPRVHNVRADNVILLDSQTVKFVNLDYDGGGPAAYFWVGTGSGPSRLAKISNSIIICISGRLPTPNRKIKTTILRRFNGEDITIKFDGELTVFDINYIGLWCESATQDFGHVDIPNMPAVIPSIITEPPPTQAPTPTPPPPFDNCEPLSDTFQVLWQIRDQSIDIELRGLIPMNNYMSFGLSGATDRTSMVGSDVVVAWLNGPEAKAVDYDLNAYSQCSGGSGACPDTESSTPGTDSVTDIAGSFSDGVTSIKYTRLLNTGKDFFRGLSGDPMCFEKSALPPAVFKNTFGCKTINFGRSAQNSCPPLISGVESTAPEPWPPSEIGPNTTQFVLKIGQSGGDRGYTAITGKPGWGISWYVNGLLIPELTVRRGISYTFRVFGGSNPARSADYHPFYITNDDAGGLASLLEDEIKNDTVIYAGPVNGSLCIYENTGEDQAATSDTFNDYFMTLTEECESPQEPAELVWTPDENTPDLVYYQCYTHRHLGWRINVVDDVTPSAEPEPSACDICLNGGTCLVNDNDFTISCRCPDGFSGPTCKREMVYCLCIP
ncbi:protein Skeletor, isoforms B/C-like [Anneissia japonica]|uniref:protein Skeletor, isoforms B/C-like n=1 Tax=Anneissia japonica TaxID=1529436 RepID=UPI0014254C68|nr:protein Skeletor, isoforms B/C-like [Anneissia japonica]